MNVSVVRGVPSEVGTPLLVLPVPESGELAGGAAVLDQRLGGQIGAIRARGDFRGREGDTLVLYPSPGAVGAERVLLVGMGKEADVTPERLRRAGGTAAKQAARVRAPSLAFVLPAGLRVDEREAARAVAEGVVLGAYTFTELKSRAEDAPAPVELSDATLLIEDAGPAAAGEGARLGEVVARAQCLARELGNLPANVVTPTYLGETAERLARTHGMQVTVLGRRELEAEGMRALLAVSQGSDQEPRLIVLEHRGGREGEKPLVMVGKGVTFDAGGISIKPAANMEEMKFDMSGAGAVLAAMQAIAEMKVPLDVIGIIPSTENLLSGSAVKPGDIVRTHLGKTVEIVNTDAEGRLILADALSYARRYDPAAVVDVATLTGACVIALGHHVAGLFTNDEALAAEIRAAGEQVGERAWQLPLLDEYREQIRSEYADIKNSGGRPAGSITAAWFLREFAGSFPWAHLDVAGTAWGDGKLPYQTRGSTGAPTRLLVQWVLARAARR